MHSLFLISGSPPVYASAGRSYLCFCFCSVRFDIKMRAIPNSISKSSGKYSADTVTVTAKCSAKPVVEDKHCDQWYLKQHCDYQYKQHTFVAADEGLIVCIYLWSCPFIIFAPHNPAGAFVYKLPAIIFNYSYIFCAWAALIVDAVACFSRLVLNEPKHHLRELDSDQPPSVCSHFFKVFFYAAGIPAPPYLKYFFH